MRTLALVIIGMLAVAPAHAIVIRHDRDDAAYRKLAKPYTMVCRIGGGMGTLIDPEWVVTAAHVAEQFPTGKGSVNFGERVVPVVEVFVHPDFAVQGKHRDIALLKLGEPVTDIAPARLYDKQDEPGKRITFVGDGQTGTGETGPARGGERVLRGAHNTVESVRPGWVTFRFDAPPDGDDLEGISGPGDSGGPALLEVNGDIFVIGVSAMNEGQPVCTYGTFEHYGRVADTREWLDGIMDGTIVPDRKPRAMRYGENEGGQVTVIREDPDVVAMPENADADMWSVVGELERTIEANDETAYKELFSDRFVAGRATENDPVEGMLEFMQGVGEKRGDIAGFHPLDRTAVVIPDSAFPMRAVIFHMADGTSGYFGIALDDEQKIDHLSLFVRGGICPDGSSCGLVKPLEHYRTDR